MNKTNKNKELIPKHIENFLKTKEGRDYFRKIVEKNGLIKRRNRELSRQVIHAKIKSFINTPQNVRNWLKIKGMLEDHISKKNT
jgi:hypothetical protein